MKKKMMIIVFLILISFISFSYARYKQTRTGNVSLRAASWNVSLNGGNNLSITTGGSETSYNLTVNNNSEVEVTYSIYLTNVPTGVSVKIDNGEYVQESNHNITFTNINTLGINQNKVHTVKFKALLDSIEVNNQNVGIDVEFKQK